jgi:hypothetical protein
MDRAWQAGKNQEENKLLSALLAFLTVSALRLLQPKCQFTPALARIFFWPTLFLRLSCFKVKIVQSPSGWVESYQAAAKLCDDGVLSK